MGKRVRLRESIFFIQILQGDAAQIEEWAKENCGVNSCPGGTIPDDSCFDNPFHDEEVPVLSPDNYAEWLKHNDPGDLSELPGCEGLLKDQSQWFDESLYGPGMTCDFNIQLTYPDDGSSRPDQMSQTIKFYETDDSQCGTPPGTSSKY